MRLRNCLNTILTLSLMLFSLYAEACLEQKLCCVQEYGELDCVTKCVDEYCPMGYNIEIKL